MFDEALKFLKDSLNEHLRLSRRYEEPTVAELSSLVKQDGEEALTTRLGMVLVRIDEERMGHSRLSTHSTAEGGARSASPPVWVNLHLLLAARPAFAGYLEALTVLRVAMEFFQSNSVFTPDRFPAMGEAGLEKLSVEMETLSHDAWNQLWGALGVKCLPSALYLIRHIPIQAAPSDFPFELVETVDVEVGS